MHWKIEKREIKTTSQFDCLYKNDEVVAEIDDSGCYTIFVDAFRRIEGWGTKEDVEHTITEFRLFE